MKYIGIFQGGGVKAIAHIGAIHALEERGFFCTKAAGTSAGAIIASLIVAGYSSNELIEIFKNLNIKMLKEKDKTIKIFKELGLYSSTPLEKYLESLYRQKGIYSYLDVKEGKDYKLKVIATDVNKKKQLVLPNDLKQYHIDPDSFSIAKSVVMSATYPLFYKPFKLGNSLIMDGSLSNNFPLDAFGYKTSEPIIGFNLINEKTTKQSMYRPYIIRIPIKKIHSMNFNIDDKTKQELFIAGYSEGKKFINNYYMNEKI